MEWDTLLHLATYTAGGLPLQVPDELNPQATCCASIKTGNLHGLRNTTSVCQRQYWVVRCTGGEPSGLSFEQAMQTRVFQPLKLLIRGLMCRPQKKRITPGDIGR